MIILKMNSRECQTLQTEELKKARKVRGQRIVGFHAQIWKKLVTPPSLLSQSMNDRLCFLSRNCKLYISLPEDMKRRWEGINITRCQRSESPWSFSMYFLLRESGFIIGNGKILVTLLVLFWWVSTQCKLCFSNQTNFYLMHFTSERRIYMCTC